MTPLLPSRENAEKPRFFISYGRLDGADLLHNLVQDLTNEYELVFDEQDLRVGNNWRTDLREMIYTSQGVIAILTPHSVRDESVCHNELADAERAKLQILPAMWKPCTPPFSINTVDYADFASLSYDVALARLRQGLADMVAGKRLARASQITESWSLQSDFDYILRNIASGMFCGREWLFERVNSWRDSDSDKRLLLVTADPGAGKSALALHFLSDQPCGRVLAAHFCGKQASKTLHPHNVVRNLAYVLAKAPELHMYREALTQPDRKEALDRLARDGGDLPIDDLLRILLEPLREIGNPFATGERSAWLVIDGLDEALEYAQARDLPSIVDLLTAQLPLLPPWLRIFATSRAGEVSIQLSKVVYRGEPLVTEIQIDQRDSGEDIDAYVEDRSRQSDPPLTKNEKRLIIERSAGNFLCVRNLLDAWLQKKFSMEDILRLVPGLDGFYQHDFNRMFKPHMFDPAFKREAAVDYRSARRILTVASAAQRRLSVDILAQTADLPRDSVLNELRRLSAYLVEREGYYSIFHKSLTDWVRNKARSGDYYVDEQEGHAALARFCWSQFVDLKRQRIRQLSELEGDKEKEYLVRYGVDHLIFATQFPEAIELLHFLTEKMLSQRGALPSVFINVSPSGFRRRVLYALGECPEKDKQRINPELLGRLILNFYQIEPLQAAMRILLHHHRDRWQSMQQMFMDADNYVLRYAISETVAEACLDDDPFIDLETVNGYLRHKNINYRELGAYVLRDLYEAQPELIDPENLELMAGSDTYAGRSALGDLLLALEFQQDDTPTVNSPRFWHPVWDHNRFDVWDVQAVQTFKRGKTPPDNADAGMISAYERLVATEILRESVATIPKLDPKIKVLVTRGGFASLPRHLERIKAAEKALGQSERLADIMRLLFSHPLWEVAENAASVFASLAEKDFQKRSDITRLFDDPCWRVRFGAIETAYQLADFDNVALFSQAIYRFYDDKISRVRALCAENLIAYLLDRPGDQKEHLDKFDAQIKRWINDDDAWVLEHVFRLLRRLDRESSDYSDYFSEGTPFLLDGLPQPLPRSGWKNLRRSQFLMHIEKRQRERLFAKFSLPG